MHHLQLKRYKIGGICASNLRYRMMTSIWRNKKFRNASPFFSACLLKSEVLTMAEVSALLRSFGSCRHYSAGYNIYAKF